MKPVLSILTPAVWSRREKSEKLAEGLAGQIGDLPVEHLVLMDNRRMTIGEKRQALLGQARGLYLAFCDDDDAVSEDYIAHLFAAAGRGQDVITFRQHAVWNGAESEVHFSINHRDEAFTPGGVTKRRPWHICAWRADLAKRGIFTSKMWGEDADWVNQVAPLARSESHIKKVLHFYRHEDSESLAMGR